MGRKQSRFSPFELLGFCLPFYIWNFAIMWREWDLGRWIKTVYQIVLMYVSKKLIIALITVSCMWLWYTIFSESRSVAVVKGVLILATPVVNRYWERLFSLLLFKVYILLILRTIIFNNMISFGNCHKSF